jgi:hypothetical protein
METPEYFGDPGLEQYKTAFANRESKPTFDVDEYADFLLMEIGLRRAELRRIRARRSNLIGRLVRLGRWAGKPNKSKPRLIPGLGFEMILIGFHVTLITGHILLSLHM